MILVSFRLDEPIDCSLLCQEIQKSMNKLGTINDPQNKMLVIRITDIIDSQAKREVLLLEHKVS